jgi:hypothetical protein
VEKISLACQAQSPRFTIAYAASGSSSIRFNADLVATPEPSSQSGSTRIRKSGKQHKLALSKCNKISSNTNPIRARPIILKLIAGSVALKASAKDDGSVTFAMQRTNQNSCPFYCHKIVISVVKGVL